MTNPTAIIAGATIGASYLAVWVCAWQLSKRQSEHDARVAVLDEVRADLRATVDEWTTRATAGDVSRSLELPGIYAVQRMLDASVFEEEQKGLRLLR